MAPTASLFTDLPHLPVAKEDIAIVPQQGLVTIAPEDTSGEIVSTIPSTDESSSGTEEMKSFEDFVSFFNATVEIKKGDTLFKIINDLSEQSGGNWVNTENGVTRGHVIAAIIANYMRQKGFYPNLIYPGDILSPQAPGMSEEWLAVLEKTWKTKSPQDYIDHVLPNAQKLLRR